MKIKRFECNPLQENCYVVSLDSGDCAIIDCGAYGEDECAAIDAYIAENSLKPVLALNTHLHFDHVLGLRHIYDRYGLKVRAHSADVDIYSNLGQQLDYFTGGAISVDNPAPLGDFLADGDVVDFSGSPVRVLHTPGHTPGGVCFYFEGEKALFSGDSLFCSSIGRTDFPGGNYRQLIESLTDKVLSLPPDVAVYPGHGPSTTVLNEMTYNPYL